MKRLIWGVVGLLALALPAAGQSRVGVSIDMTPYINGSGVARGCISVSDTAGVQLCGDGDGALTLTGLGDGSDEALTVNLDDTANQATWSSSTGVTTFRLSAMSTVLDNNTAYQARNAADNDTEPLIWMDGSDNIQIGDATPGAVDVNNDLTVGGKVNVEATGAEVKGPALNIKGPATTATGLSDAAETASIWIEPDGETSWGLAVGRINATEFPYIQGVDRAESSSRKLMLQPYGGDVEIASLGTGANYFVCASAAGLLSEATSACAGSTRDIKEDVRGLTNGLDLVRQLHPITFRYSETYRPVDQKRYPGFIAEDVAAVDPMLASYTTEGDLHGVEYAQMSAVTVAALQELVTQVSDLAARIAALEAQE